MAARISFDLLAIVPGTIFAVHAAENRVGLPDCSGTCACLAMRGDEATRSMSSSDQSIGLYGGDAEFFEIGVGEDRADQGFEAASVVGGEVAAPAAEIDAADHDFAVAGGDKGVYLANNF